MEIRDAIGLQWIARLFLAIGVGAAVVCVGSTLSTLRFVSESTRGEGTVVDWVQGGGAPARSSQPGAYHRVIEVEGSDGRRFRGEAEVGVGMGQLVMGERVAVRYRPGDPTRMRVASLTGLWLVELVTAVLAIAFGAAGWFLARRASGSVNDPE